MTSSTAVAGPQAAWSGQERPADVQTALLLLDRLGVSAEEIIEARQAIAVEVPTFRQYIPVVFAAAPASSARTWSIYWRVLGERWSDSRIDEPPASALKALANEVQERAARGSGTRGGRGAKSSFVDATKFFYRCAVADNLVSSARNPAASLKKPRQVKSLRRALSARQLTEINQVAASTGRDPALDTLILRLHTETACRRGGALSLRPCDVNVEMGTARLREKGGTVRDQPISRTLALGLLRHARGRSQHLSERDQLLRHRNGHPIHYTRYEALWRRLSGHLPWISELGVTAHWIRYTTLTWVERNYGYAVAATFAGHAAGYQTGTTLTYVAAPLEELAAAVAALTGEPHPLAA